MQRRRERLSARYVFKRPCLLHNSDFTLTLEYAIFELNMDHILHLVYLVIAIDELKRAGMPTWYSKCEWKFILALLHWVLLKLLLRMLLYLKCWSKLEKFRYFLKQGKVAILCVIKDWLLIFWEWFLLFFIVILELRLGGWLLLFGLWSSWNVTATYVALSWLVDWKEVHLTRTRWLLVILLRDWWCNSTQ